MGNASVGASNVPAQQLRAAGKAERSVIQKLFAPGERFDFASGERIGIADRIENAHLARRLAR
jgi:hypothetical protein